MKKTAEVKVAEDKIAKEIAKLEKKKAELEKKLEKIHCSLPFRCKKCKTSYALKDVHVMDFEVRETHQNCQYGGEYDLWQEVLRKHLACCPKCGKSFNVRVAHDDFISETPRYSRWEKKPEIREEYSKPLLKKARKIDSYELKYLKENWRNSGFCE